MLTSRLGSVLNFCGFLKSLEVPESAVVYADLGGLETLVGGHRAGIAMEFLKGEVGAGFRLQVRVRDVKLGALGIHGVIDGCRFECANTAEAPGGGDHLIDKVRFGLAGRKETPVVPFAEEGELVRGFVMQQDGAGVHAVGFAVARGVGLAFGRSGAV